MTGALRVLICGAGEMSARTLAMLGVLARAAALREQELVVHFDRIRITRMVESFRDSLADLRLPDFSKDLKALRAERLSALERVQLQRHEPRIKPHNPRVTGADIRRFIPRRTR